MICRAGEICGGSAAITRADWRSGWVRSRSAPHPSQKNVLQGCEAGSKRRGWLQIGQSWAMSMAGALLGAGAGGLRMGADGREARIHFRTNDSGANAVAACGASG